MENRIEFLKELNIAEQIIPFNEEIIIKLIKRIKPDILVKGGDCKESEIVGKEFANKTIILPYIDGYSTTNIINKTRCNSKLI